MARSHLRVRLGLTVTTLALAGSLVAGCGSETPLGIADGLSQKGGPTLYADQWIDSDGGVLSIGPYLLNVPAGAVSSNTHFQLQQLQTNSWDVDMSPHGFNFSTPLTLSLDASSEPDPNSLSLSWWNPDTGNWENQPTTHSGNNVVGEISHFSRYGFK